MTRTERTYYLVVALWNLPGWFMHPVYPMFLLSRGLDLFEIGVVFATFQIGVFLFEVPTGAIADLYGRKVSFLLSCLIRLSAFLMYTVADGFLMCVLAELVDAIGVTLASGAIDAWAVDGVRAEGDRRPADRMFARSQAIVRGVMVVGGVACGYLADRFGLTVPWLVASGFFVIAFFAGLVLMYDDRVVRRATADTRPATFTATIGSALVAVRDHAVLRMLCALTLLTGMAAMPVVMYWPPHLEALSTGGFWLLGWAWAILNLAAVLGSLVVVPLLRRLARERLLFVIALWRAALLLVAALAGSFGGVLAALVLYEMAVAARQPVVTAWINEHVGSDLRATVLSVGGMSFMLGGALGVVTIGLVTRAFGIPSGWLVCVVLLLAMAPLYLLLGRIAHADAAARRAAAA